MTRFGAATAAYQIEGAAREDGRGQSIWDVFSHRAGGDTGDVACDHYHRWASDLDLMVALGLESYRFSIAWPRVQPDGRGALNPRGVAWYRRMIEGCLERGLEPVATLYHWDLPQARQEAGGWAVRDTALRFAEYAALMADSLGDLVGAWITHNEPWVVAILGHAVGHKAPGIRDWPTALTVAHHLLLSHGLAVDALRGTAPVGITLNLNPMRGDEPEAVARMDAHQNRWFLDPGAARDVSGRAARALRADVRLAAGAEPRGHGRDLAADRLPRRQLLQPDLRAQLGGRPAAGGGGDAARARRPRWAGRSTPPVSMSC